MILSKVSKVRTLRANLRTTVFKYGELDDRTENSNSLLLRQKDLSGELFSEIGFKGSSKFNFGEV